MADYNGSRLSRRLKSHRSSHKIDFHLYYHLVKPGIVYANVITGASGYLLASRCHVKIFQLLALLVGLGLIVAGSCVFNNYIDRKIDSRMERTKARALASKQIGAKKALLYGSALLVIGFLLLMFTNALVILLGLLAVIFYVVFYGFAKRYSVYGTLVGTLPGSASLVAGYCAYTDRLNGCALLLLLLMICWQMAHFYAIAIYRLDDYRLAGLPLWPLKKGIDSTQKQIRLFIVGFLGVSFLLAILGYAGYSFLAAMVLGGGFWLNLAYKLGNNAAWAKKVFLCSLVVMGLMSVMLPVSKLIP